MKKISLLMLVILLLCSMTIISNAESLGSSQTVYIDLGSIHNLVQVRLSSGSGGVSVETYDSGEWIMRTNGIGNGTNYDINGLNVRYIRIISQPNTTIPKISIYDGATKLFDSDLNPYLYENPVSATPTPTPTPLSSPVLIGNAGNTGVSLQWNTISGANGYKVYQDGVMINDTLDTQYSVLGLINGQSYTFKVLAYNFSVQSGYSNMLVLTPQSNVTPTPAPTPTPTPTPFSFVSKYPSGSVIAENGTIHLTYTGNISNATVEGDGYSSHSMSGNVLVIQTSATDGETIDLLVSVTDANSVNLTHSVTYTASKDSLEGTMDLSDITNWVDDLISKLRESSIVVIVTILVLIALAIGAFWLIGIGKKGVKRSK